MNAVADTAVFFAKFLYYFLESLVFKVVPKRKKNVAGEIVLITGAGSGLGRLLAMHFASHGAILVLWDINQEGNMETCRLAKEKGGVKVFTYKCDCSNRKEVYRVADQVREEVGDVTILINNAGVVTGKPFLDIPDHMVERSFLVNSISHFWVSLSFIFISESKNPKQRFSHSSVNTAVGCFLLKQYSSSKFAAFGFAESLFFELTMLQKSKVKSTIVCPYFIKTGMFEGCETKYPLLLPLLDQEYVAQKIFTAILEEQVYLLIPKFAYFALFLKQ
ncbi:Short-chain dehydrogenase/reductase family 16C member 6 [Lemmus lemmus]